MGRNAGDVADDANSGAHAEFSTGEAAGAVQECPWKKAARQLANDAERTYEKGKVAVGEFRDSVKKNLDGLLTDDEWAGMKIIKDNVLPWVNAQGMLVDATFRKVEKAFAGDVQQQDGDGAPPDH